MGADPLTYSLSLLSIDSSIVDKTLYPIIVRKATKNYGSQKVLEYSLQDITTCDKILLLDDVITTGGSTLKAYNTLRQAGFEPLKKVFCVVNRSNVSTVQKDGITLSIYSLFNLSDLLS